MPDLFPIQKLHRAGVVVWDLHAAVRNYTEIYGIEDWSVFHFTPDRLKDSRFLGADVSHQFSIAVGETPGSAIRFELVQPGMGGSTFKHFLYTKGEGVHHLLLNAGDDANLGRVRDIMNGQGVREIQSGNIDGVYKYATFDTRERLGGFYIQAVASDGGAEFDSVMDPDERWDVRSEVSGGWPEGGPFSVPQLGHFGVVVRDLLAKAESYRDFFGFDNWTFGLHNTNPGSLEGPTNNGQPVVHSYFTSSRAIENFGFEIIQPAFGPQHYKEDYLDVVGEGIHHLYVYPPPALADDSEWQHMRDWMAGLQIPMVMSGRLAGRADFYYLDTRAKLGYVSEAVVRIGGGSGGPPRQTPRSDAPVEPMPRVVPPIQNGSNRTFPIDWSKRAGA